MILDITELLDIVDTMKNTAYCTDKIYLCFSDKKAHLSHVSSDHCINVTDEIQKYISDNMSFDELVCIITKKLP